MEENKHSIFSESTFTLRNPKLLAKPNHSALASATKNTLGQYSKEQRVAHLYQTNEATILRSMMKAIGKSLVVPKHDAIIITQALSPNEIINLQDKVYQDTGFKITLKGKWL